MNTTIKARNRILSLGLALCLLLGMTLYLPGPVEVNAADVEIGKADVLTPDPSGSGTVSGNQVYFGEFDGDPILWRVLENSGGEALLFSEKILTSMPFKEYINIWGESSIREYLNTELLRALPNVLQDVLVDADTTISGSDPTTDKLYLLSAEEADLSTVDRNIGANWWLRSPGDFAFVAAMVDNTGTVQTTHNYSVNGNFGIRPAFQIPTAANIYTASGDGSQGAPWVVDEQGSTQQTLVEGAYVQIAVSGTGDKLWEVIAVDDGIATLLCADSLETRVYNEYGNIWGRSDVRAYLNPEDGAYEANSFSFVQGEKAAVVAKNISEKNEQTSDRLFLLSYDEADTSTYFANDNARKSSVDWWLRSPSGGSYADGVLSNGHLGDVSSVDSTLGIRPAFYLDLSSVIFTSDASGASPKSDATVGSTLLSVPKAPTDKIKLTIEDTAINTPDLTFVETTNNTGELRFLYAGAETGNNQYISCVLVDSGGDVAYYGKLAGCATDADGEFAIDTTAITAGTYTLKIFCEQANDDPYTDFAGASENMTLEVISGSGEIRDFTGETLGAPTISADPVNQSVNEGSTASFTVVATGSGLTYQWQVSTDDGNNFNNTTDGAGGNTDTYTTPATTMSMSGYQYQVVVKNLADEMTSTPATLTVNDTAVPEYSISIDSMTNGSVTVNGGLTQAEQGTVIYLTVTPDHGYRLQSGSLRYNTTPINGASFTMPGEDVTIYADFEPVPSTPSVSVDSLTIPKGETRDFVVYLGSGSDEADEATVTSNNPSVATVNLDTVDTDGTTVTVTGVAKGNAIISLGWSGGSQGGTSDTVNVEVTDDSGGEPGPDPGDNTHRVTVTASPEEGGNPVATPTNATPTQIVEVKANPNAGWEFTGWSGGPGVAFDNASHEVTTFEMPDSAVTITASYTKTGGGGDPGPTVPETPGGVSSGSTRSGRSGSSGSGNTTPAAKTSIPASAFTWEGRTLTIDHDSISVLGLLSVQWDGKALTRGTDYGVYQGSVIVRFGEDFMAAQSPGDHNVRVEFLNHTGDITVTVDDTGLTTGEPNDDLFDNDTHNPSTGGYPDGSYPGTDNPNTGDGRGIWTALLLGSLGAAVLVKLRPSLRVKN